MERNISVSYTHLDGTRNFVRLYFSDILSGLGMRYAHSWDSRNNTYFPNANFFTYASCCIRNRLNKELYPKKRKKTKDFFEQEKHNMSYIETVSYTHLS